MDRKRMGWRIVNVAREADLLVYDVIGDEFAGTCAADFVHELMALRGKVERVRFHFKSEGGYVDDALAMYDAILNFPGETESHIVTAYSAASFVAMGAKRRYISKTGKVMVHDALVGHIGMFNVQSLDEYYARTKATLESESENIASIYADRAGGSQDAWRERMQANGRNGTEYRGQAAVDVGLAHEVTATRNAFPERIAALMEEPPKNDTKDPLADVLAQLPPLADIAGYRKPLPSLEGLLTKHPLKVGA